MKSTHYFCSNHAQRTTDRLRERTDKQHRSHNLSSVCNWRKALYYCTTTHHFTEDSHTNEEKR